MKQQRMNKVPVMPQRKTLLIIAVTWLLLLSALDVVIYRFTLANIQQVEKKDALHNVERVQDNLQNEKQSLLTLTKNLASVEGVWRLLKAPNSAVDSSAQLTNMLGDAPINVVLIIDKSAGVLFAQCYNRRDRRTVPVPPELFVHIRPGTPLNSQRPQKDTSVGFLAAGGQIVMIASHALMPKNGQGPSLGTLIMGRYLDDEFIGQLRRVSGLRIHQRAPDQNQQPPIQITDKNSITAYILLHDVYGKPVRLLQIDMSRAFFRQSIAGLHLLLILITVLGILFGSALLALLRQTLLAHYQKRQGSDLFNILGETSPDAVVFTDATSRILYANLQAAMIFGFSAGQRLQEKQLLNLVGKSDRDYFQENLEHTLSKGDVRTVEYLLNKENGEPFFGEICTSLFSAVKNEAPRLLHIIRDISSRKQTEEKIKKFAAKLKSISAITNQVTALLEQDKLIHQVIDSIHETTNCYNVNLMLLRGNHLELVAGRGGYAPNINPIGYRIEVGQGIIGYVAQEREPQLIPDVNADARYCFWEGLPETRSELAVPIKSGSKLIGILDMQSVQVAGFDSADMEILSTFADQLAVSMENVRLFEETRRRAQELETLSSVSTALRTATSRDDMLPIILEQVIHLLQADGAAFAKPGNEENEIVIELGWGTWKDISNKTLQAGDLNLTRWNLNKPNHIAIPPAQEIPSAAFLHGLSFLAVEPLIAQGNAFGQLLMGKKGELSAAGKNLLGAIANIAANAIHRASLHDQTEKRLRQLEALSTIDKAIGASPDLQATLNILLDQVCGQLGVDAATVLLYIPAQHTLKYVASSGFYSDALKYTRLNLGEGYAGKTALELHRIWVSDLKHAPNGFSRSPLLPKEDFVTYIGVPLLAKDQLKGVLEIFHRSTLNPDPDWLSFLDALCGQAAIAIDNATLFDGLQKANQELIQAYDATIEGWAHALEIRDHETEGHSRRVTDFTVLLAAKMGFSTDETVHIRRGALLHDIGKMGIPDSILLKPGKLDENEWVVMRQHPVIAHNLLWPVTFLRPALDIPYCHHEKWDGTGYPRQLKGEEIPLPARIFAVIDVWDALASDRPYRRAWEADKILSYITELSGEHFDPQVLQLFLQSLKK